LETNFVAPFSLRGKIWPSLVHYVEAQKFHDTIVEEKIRLAATPEEALLIAIENEATVRPHWEKIHEEIMLEGILSKFDQHSELREFLISNEIFVGECANTLIKAQSMFRRLEPNECIVFDLYEDDAVKKKYISAHATSEKREKAKARKNVWKDNSGASLVEVDSSNTVSLVGYPLLSFPINALSNNGKSVVKKYQYEKRFLNNDDDGDDDDGDDDEYNQSRTDRGKIYLSDFIEDGKGISVPDFLRKSNFTLQELQNSRLNGSNLEELVVECRNNQIQAQELIEKGDISEEFMDKLLQLLDSLNAVLF